MCDLLWGDVVIVPIEVSYKLYFVKESMFSPKLKRKQTSGSSLCGGYPFFSLLCVFLSCRILFIFCFAKNMPRFLYFLCITIQIPSYGFFCLFNHFLFFFSLVGPINFYLFLWFYLFLPLKGQTFCRYPSDMDKHILARQTGLSRSQACSLYYLPSLI